VRDLVDGGLSVSSPVLTVRRSLTSRLIESVLVCRGLFSLLPLLVSALALVVIAVGAGERKVRRDRRKAGWKGVAALVAFSGEPHTPDAPLATHRAAEMLKQDYFD
jgi:hypothetical protein